MQTAVDVVAESVPGDQEPGCLLRIHPVTINSGLVYLGSDPTTIGRDEACRIRLADRSVSREHAIVGYDGMDAYVRDCGSTNGTFVNDIRVPNQPFRLHPGDRIRCGTHVFKYLSSGDIETQYHEAAYTMMTRDGSTGVWNKPSLMEHFDREIGRAITRDRCLSLILLDIDHFKQINDRFGHLAGDQVLQGIGKQMQDLALGEELIARFGGEEFAVLLPEESLAGAVAWAEDCRHLIESSTVDTCAGPIKVTISLGVAELEEVASNTGGYADLPDADTQRRQELRSALISLCDERMYAAKTSGRNRVGV